MKIYNVLGALVVTGKPQELDAIRKLAGGSYHIAKNPPKGIKRKKGESHVSN